VALSPARSARAVARTIGLTLVVAALPAATLFLDGSSAGSGYPFLDTGPVPAPDVVYMPSYVTLDVQPSFMTVSKDHRGNVDVEMASRLRSGDELRIWQSNRFDASVTKAVGSYVEGTRVIGTHMKWTSGRTQDGRANLLYARIGSTLVVIVGALSHEELLRLADSLQRTSSSALVL
jgi:hypothetical protein